VAVATSLETTMTNATQSLKNRLRLCSQLNTFKCALKCVLRSALIFACLFASNVMAKSVGLVVTGIGGNEEYAQNFREQGLSVVEALRSVGDDDQDFVLLSDEAATRDAVLDQMQAFAKIDSQWFYLVLIGHGTIDSETWRFNLPGDDIATDDLVAALADITSPEQVVLVGTSASGAVLDILSQPGRHVVTATKSGGELNVVRFPEFFAQAMATTAADTDRNEILTLAEAYRFSNEKTQDYYTEKKLLASEHARLEGDKPDRVALARLGSLKSAKDDPAVAQLLEKRLVLEDEFLALKARKPSMDTALFYEELEPLLVDIARLQQEIDSVTGWVDTNE